MSYEKQLEKFRQEKDYVFKNHYQSPLTEEQRASFVKLNYYRPNILLRFQVELNNFKNKIKLK